MKTGIIILAAGNSSRLGRPKQLLSYKGKTLLEIVIDAALQTLFSPVIVVLGAYAKEIIEKSSSDVVYVINDSWKKGMSSSIAAGMAEVTGKSPDLENVVIAVSDQVFITADIFENLHRKWRITNKGIIASNYASTTGTPALFNKKYFNELLSLQGNKGAKPILMSHNDDIDTITFELGYIDIDTEKDYRDLIKN